MRAMSLLREQGLYNPHNEHDSCGVGFVVDIKNRRRHDIVRQGLEILVNVTHRGAVGADTMAGDGAGILMQLPDTLLREEVLKCDFSLPDLGDYGVGMVFLPMSPKERHRCQSLIEEITLHEGQRVLGWRDVPTDNRFLGKSVQRNEPVIRQVFIACGAHCADQDAFERKLYVIRKRVENAIEASPEITEPFYVPTLSSRTICYKGMMLAENLGHYYPDLQDERIDSALALVHQRFSTNTFPSWELSQPFRFLCHNGEINTVRGNINWMNSRRHSMRSTKLGDDLAKLWPIIGEGKSDSATFDNALEILLAGGYSLAHAMMLMIPEAWEDNPLMDSSRRAFYEYYAGVMEPWDGPAAVAFTDGRQIGATLDRNGLRPARYIITDDDRVIMGSEVGVLCIPEERIVKKWRLQPGKMFLIDLEQGRIVDDAELKATMAEERPYQQWLAQSQVSLTEIAKSSQVKRVLVPNESLLERQRAFGYSQEDLKFLLAPMLVNGEEAIGSMGADNPVAVLSGKSKHLANYFKQNFAQVTNPPIDPIREELVMSLLSIIGPRPNLLGLDEFQENRYRLEVDQPILTNTDLRVLRDIERYTDGAFRSVSLDICYPVTRGTEGMESALDALCQEAQSKVSDGYNVLILSDRSLDAHHLPIPSLLATAAVHHHLVRAGLRTATGLVVETGSAREVHHFCTLAGYGAEAVNPYLAFETLRHLREQMDTVMSEEDAEQHYIKALGKGIRKVMSKMGISTYLSYCGAQIFDAVGLSSELIQKYFSGTATAVEGIGLEGIAEESMHWHQQAYGHSPLYANALDVGGDYAYRIHGEGHMWTPQSVSRLQHAVRGNDAKSYAEFASMVNEQNEQLLTLRGLFEFNFPD